MIHFGCWYWGKKYPLDYVTRLREAVSRNYSGPHRFHVWSPVADDEKLTRQPGCFARLRTFDPSWQAIQYIAPGQRIVCLDLDLVVTGNLNPLFDRPDDFTILQGVNAVNPCPYNGSAWMLRAGYRPDVFHDFTMEAARQMPFYAFPDDQAWFHHKIPGAAALTPADGAYAFKKRGWPQGEKLPANARIVAFPGHRDPQQFIWLPWVQKHWMAA